jgi:hypothetical protein
MKKNWKRPLMALVLAVSMALALPVSSIMAETIDSNAKCSLNVTPGTFDDLKNANVVYDLYKVATIVPDTVYETYGYEATAAYSSLNNTLQNTDKLSSEDWSNLALEAAKITFADGQSIATTLSGAKVNTVSDQFTAGLYLLIARGSDIDDYVIKSEDGTISTIAYSNQYVYTFSPELIALPSKDAENGKINTANRGSWKYDVSVTLKPEQSIRFGNLEITKTLDTYESSEPATFVFQIEALLRGKTVYSNVVALNFTSAGQKQILIKDKIPVGAKVTVTEVYSGAKYKLTSDSSQTTTILNPTEGTATVGFTNTYSATNLGGHGIVNHFIKGSDGWTVDNSTDNATK